MPLFRCFVSCWPWYVATSESGLVPLHAPRMFLSMERTGAVGSAACSASSGAMVKAEGVRAFLLSIDVLVPFGAPWLKRSCFRVAYHASIELSIERMRGDRR